MLCYAHHGIQKVRWVMLCPSHRERHHSPGGYTGPTRQPGEDPVRRTVACSFSMYWFLSQFSLSKRVGKRGRRTKYVFFFFSLEIC